MTCISGAKVYCALIQQTEIHPENFISAFAPAIFLFAQLSAIPRIKAKKNVTSFHGIIEHPHILFFPPNLSKCAHPARGVFWEIIETPPFHATLSLCSFHRQPPPSIRRKPLKDFFTHARPLLTPSRRALLAIRINIMRIQYPWVKS